MKKPANSLSEWIRAGDLAAVAEALRAGADPHYVRPHGYTAILDAAYSQIEDPCPLFELLLAHGVDPNAVSDFGESALRVCSNQGDFEAVRVLLRGGGDEKQLAWTPLHRAIALGTTEEVEHRLSAFPAEREQKDAWERSPWLLAIQKGELQKVEVILRYGPDRQARGRCGKTPLAFAIESGNVEMLRWLLERGEAVEQADDFENRPAQVAAERGDIPALKLLIEKGASLSGLLANVADAPAAAALLEAGADPADLSNQIRRALAGFPEESDPTLLPTSRDDFERGSQRRFGRTNPELSEDPFCLAMIRSGINAWKARSTLAAARPQYPVWCAERFGQSLTRLADGRAVLIGGEHEDYYDTDFCIYNDVIVRHPDGTIQLFLYPEADFPPTDFHTATLVDDGIYLIGSLGYAGTRKEGHTPVYRLNLRNFRMEAVPTRGEAPGWIYRHRATLQGHQIRVEGGKIWQEVQTDETTNLGVALLDVRTGVWKRLDPGG